MINGPVFTGLSLCGLLVSKGKEWYTLSIKLFYFNGGNMIDRVDIKEQSRAQLAGKVWPIFGCLFIAGLVVGASELLSAVPIVGILVPIVIQGAILLGIAQLMLNVTYGDEPSLEAVFSGFKSILQAALMSFLVGLFVSLWSLLFVIPGIVMAISYSMSWYIMCENPDMSAMDCIRESKSIMHGHKMEYFILMLSFIGWILLGTVTFGIAYIYVGPYMKLASVNFYHRIKNVYSNDEGYSEISSEPVADNNYNEPEAETVSEASTDSILNQAEEILSNPIEDIAVDTSDIQ